ncbi:Asp-tRNAAsn/Glu-tRNAGln amidotransferase subunit A-like protein [Gracilaria domingensis]|nr:Asp-tRNAAsn/Glu-tRNAGln amidotransferase subunit A-like protein [Gracilaria domingensis]
MATDSSVESPQTKGEAPDLHDLSFPSLSGIPLRAAAYMLEQPYLGVLPRYLALRSSSILAWRARHSSTVDCLPSIPNHLLPSPASSPPHLRDLDQFFYALTPNVPQRGARISLADLHHAYSTALSTPSLVISALAMMVDESNALEPPLNALRPVNIEVLQQDIKASVTRWASGRPRSVLDGAPFSVKYCIDVAKLPSSIATRHAPVVAEKDAPVVAALKRLGMIPITKSNQDEVALGTRGFSSATGCVRNPYDSNRCAGGSSAGCAAAVASGLVSVSIGSDSAGSVRIPASCCGVFGLKPTFGRLSMRGLVYGDELSPLPAVRSLGIISAKADDLALIYHALAAWASAEDDGGSPAKEVPSSVLGDVEGLSVGVYDGWNSLSWDGGQKACEKAVTLMQEDGAIVKKIVVPDLEEIRLANSVCLMHQAIDFYCKKGLYNRSAGNAQMLGSDVRLKMAVGREFTEDDEMRARGIREKAISDAARIFESVDVIVTPCIAVQVPEVPVDVVNGDANIGVESAMMRFTAYANLVGLPAISFPVGLDEDGLPVGVQAIAGAWNEDTLIRIARWSEQKFETCVPPQVYQVLDENGVRKLKPSGRSSKGGNSAGDT